MLKRRLYRRKLSNFFYVVGKVFRDVGKAVLRYLAEITTVVVFIAGWYLTTRAVAEVVAQWGYRSEIWSLSGGLLCIGLVGYQFVWRFLYRGVYVLLKQDTETKPPSS